MTLDVKPNKNGANTKTSGSRIRTNERQLTNPQEHYFLAVGRAL